MQTPAWNPGRPSNRFEILAALHGAEAALAVAGAGDVITIHSDATEVVALFSRVQKGSEPGKAGNGSTDLLPRIRAAVGDRELVVRKVNGHASLEHRHCHDAAALRLRQEIETNPRLRYGIALAREEHRLAQLLNQRAELANRVLAADLEIAIRRVQLEALRQAGNGLLPC